MKDNCLIFRESATFNGVPINGRRTFAVKVVNEVPGSTDMSVGFSRCSNKDHFCKKRGREIAIGRATKVPCKIASLHYNFYIQGPSSDKQFPKAVREMLVLQFGFRWESKSK